MVILRDLLSLISDKDIKVDIQEKEEKTNKNILGKETTKEVNANVYKTASVGQIETTLKAEILDREVESLSLNGLLGKEIAILLKPVHR